MATKAIKICAVDFVKRFLDSLVDSSPALEVFNQRPIEQKLAVVTGRLVDQSANMLDKWREEGKNGALSPLPIFLMGFAKEYSSSGLEKGRSIAMYNYSVQDDLGNWFRVRVDKHDQRVQVVLYARDHETAFLFASQFKLFCADYKNRHSYTLCEYNGHYYRFPMTLEDNNVFGANQQIDEQDNLTVLVFDLTFTCHTPYFLGDVVQNTPYLSVVNAVVVDTEEAKRKESVFHKVEGQF